MSETVQKNLLDIHNYIFNQYCSPSDFLSANRVGLSVLQIQIFTNCFHETNHHTTCLAVLEALLFPLPIDALNNILNIPKEF